MSGLEVIQKKKLDADEQISSLKISYNRIAQQFSYSSIQLKEWMDKLTKANQNLELIKQQYDPQILETDRTKYVENNFILESRNRIAGRTWTYHDHNALVNLKELEKKMVNFKSTEELEAKLQKLISEHDWTLMQVRITDKRLCVNDLQDIFNELVSKKSQLEEVNQNLESLQTQLKSISEVLDNQQIISKNTTTILEKNNLQIPWN